MKTSERAPKRGRLSLLLGTAFASVMFVAAAQADQLVNNLDSSVDADFEVLALNHAATGNVGLYVNATSGAGDSENGCNLGGGNENESVTFSVTSSDTTVATVTSTTTQTSGPNRTTISGSDFTIRSCASAGSPNVTLQIAAQGTGASTRSADIAIAVVADNAPGSFVADTARFRVNVAPPPNTAPTVAVTGVTPSASYPKGSVPTAGCTVSDTEDGLSGSTTAATPQVGAVAGPYAADGIGLQTVTCSYTDGGDLNTVASATYGITDPSAPGISPVVVGTLGANGWYTSDVSLSWNVSEPDSPSSLLLTGCVPQSVVADQAELTYSCTASSAGGSTGPVTQAIKRDASVPAYDCGVLPAGWQAANVVLSCTAQDVGPSGLATSPTFQLLTALADGEESAAAPTNAEAVADNAGNGTSAQYSFMVDRKAPALACDSAPSGWSAVDIAIGCTAADAGSGLADPADATFQLTTDVADGTETDDASTGTKTVADGVGNSATAGPISGIRVDKKAPAVVRDGAADACSVPGLNDWCRGEQTAGFTVSDDGSGIADDGAASRSVTRSSSENGAAVAIPSGPFADLVGNSSPGLSPTFKIDSVSPMYDCGVVPTGWHGTNVILSCTAQDATSGLAESGDAAFELATAVAAGEESDAVTTDARMIEDVAGNETTAVVAPLKVDLKAPVVACDSAPSAWSAVDVAIGCTAADGGSGLADPADASFQLTTSVPDGTETDDASTGARSVPDDVGNAAPAGPVTGVRVDKKAPVVMRDNRADACSLPGNNGWCRGVQAAGFTVTDGGSGLAPDGAASRDVVRWSDENGSNVAISSGSFADMVGNSNAGIDATFQIDSVAPTYDCDEPSTEWQGSNVSVSCTAADATSGLADESDASFQLSTALPAGQESDAVSTGSRLLFDEAGNDTTAVVAPFKIDLKAPSVECGSAPSAWSATDVSVDCAADDGGSGLANASDAVFQLWTSVPEGTETDDASTAARSVLDAVGNGAQAGPVGGAKVDKKAPVVAAHVASDSCSLPGLLGWCRGEQTAGFVVTDGGSGLFGDSAAERVVTRSSSDNGESVAIASGGFEDMVGNETTGIARTFKIDSVAPSYDCGTLPTGWQAANVTLSCTAQDGTSGVAGSASFQLLTALPAGQESASVSTGSRLLTDVAGNQTTAVVAPFMIDRKAPVVECDAAPTAWSATDVTVDCTAADGGSGLHDAADAAFHLTTSVPAGTETDDASTGTRAVLDGVGNAAQAGPVSGAHVDKKAPVVERNTASDSCSLPGQNGWCRGTQTAAFTVTDGGSGIADDGASVRGVSRSTSDNGAAVSIASGAFADMVGNSTAGISATFKIDSVPPQVTCAATPTFLARQLPGTVKATVTDATSGALAATVTGQATNTNGGTVTLIGYDNAGNSATVQCAYHVGSFTFEQPIDGHALNIAKLGRVVPVKGVARVDGAVVTDGPVSIGAASRVDCATGLGTDDIEVYAAAGSSNTGNLFRWDATGQKWIYNFDTSVLGAGNCYRLNVYYGGTVSSGVATGGALIDYFLLRANR